MNARKGWTEFNYQSANGYLAFTIGLGLELLGVYLLVISGLGPMTKVVLAIISFFVGTFVLVGLYMLQPNEGAILTLFGDYKGTDRTPGLRWCFPLYTRKKISLRARNMMSEKLKVNDKSGNPIEIGAVIVWRVHDTAQAVFEIDDYETYVRLQSESAIRHVASSYAYDHSEELDGKHQTTLRGGADDVARALADELQQRFEKAGVVVEEAKLTHLAYAPEIAGAMLRRQQAEAVIAARSKIVQGAVSMVEMALHGLSEKQIVVLDNERKASMVSNLLVVLCAESNVQPIVNTGTLYN